eukprot:TCONS_00045974-protein
MLVGYNYMHHLKTFGYTDKDLEGFDHHDAHDDTIVVLDVNQKMIYYIRVLTDQAPSIDDYYKEIARCDDFVKSLFMLHGERLTDHSIGVCSLLALPMVQLKDCDRSLLSVSENSKECCILFKEHLESKDSLKKELDQYLHRIHTIRKSSKLSANGNHFEKIIAESMATMSLQQAFLPRLTMDTQEQILSLFLNGEQYEAINHPNNKRIIRGPFGSGKSLVLEKIAEKLYDSMQEGIIYYICYDPYSLLDARMEEIFKEVTDKHQDPGNVKFVTSTVYQLLKDAGETETITNDLVKVMKHCLQEANGQQVHFLFDEVGIQYSYFTKENADSLKKFVDDESSLAMSTIILALQCTEKELTVHDGKGLTVELKNYCNDRINLTGLELLRPLTKSMRMVKNLYKLKEVAEDKAGQDSVVTALKNNEIPRKPSTPDNNINKKTKAASQPKPSIQSTTLTTPPRNSTTSLKKIDPSSPSFNIIVEPEVVRTALDGKKEVHKSNENATMSSTMNLSPTKISVDQLAMYSTEPFTQDESKSMGGKFEHNFKFHPSKVGVSIPGKKASIVYLNKSFEMSSLAGAMVLQEILSSEILFQRDVKSTIICSNQEELDAVMFVIKKVFDEESYCQYTPLISKDIPTREQKRDAWLKCNSPSHKILVTDFQSFRGCEAEHCVTFLKANDANYIPHILVEVFARAIAHLSVLVMPPPSTDNGNGRFQEVLKTWRDEKLADVFEFNSKDTEAGFELTLNSVSGADGSRVIDSKQINIERSSQEEFDAFKKRSNKDHEITECLRLFNENLAVHVPDILSLSLKKLTNDAMSLDQLDFVEQKHFGFLVGYGGAVIKSLKRDLGVDIEIEEVEKSFKIRGSFEKKVNAVKVIKKMLDTEFWETLDIPDSLHRDILSQKYHWEQKFQVRVEKTEDRKKIQIQGEIGNVRKVLEEINKISNSRMLNCESVLTGMKEEKVCSPKPKDGKEERKQVLEGIKTLTPDFLKDEKRKKDIDEALMRFKEKYCNPPKKDDLKAAKGKFGIVLEDLKLSFKENFLTCKNTEYTGSTYEGLKISGDGLEFDVMFLFEGGEDLKVLPIKDEEGFAHLALIDNGIVKKNAITKSADKDGKILSKKLKDKFKGTLQNFINNSPQYKELITMKEHGPAIQFDIKRKKDDKDLWYSVDLLPSFEVKVNEEKHIYVPKKIGTDQNSWRRSFSKEEKALLRDIDSGNKNRREVARTLKAMIKKELKNIPSYAIKTTLLHICYGESKIDEELWVPQEYTNRVFDMLALLEGYFKEKWLPNYFLPTQNLLKSMNDRNLEQVENRLRGLRMSHKKFLNLTKTDGDLV